MDIYIVVGSVADRNGTLFLCYGAFASIEKAKETEEFLKRKYPEWYHFAIMKTGKVDELIDPGVSSYIY